MTKTPTAVAAPMLVLGTTPALAQVSADVDGNGCVNGRDNGTGDGVTAKGNPLRFVDDRS